MTESGVVSDFGGRMRRLREERGLTLRDIAGRTNISVAQLDALERNDVKRLPGGIFRRSIIRSYAQEVGADPEAAVRDFVASVPGESGDEGRNRHPTDYEKATTPSRGRPLLVLLGFVGVVLALIWLLSRLI